MGSVVDGFEITDISVFLQDPTESFLNDNSIQATPPVLDSTIPGAISEVRLTFVDPSNPTVQVRIFGRPVTIELAIADQDGDTVPDDIDNCPTVPNLGQEQTGNNVGGPFGDACVDPNLDLSDVDIGANPVVGGGTVFEDGIVVRDNAQIGSNAQFKQDVMIGDNAVIGDETIIEVNTMLGDDVTLGFKVKLEENVVIENRVDIGDETLVKKDAVIEADASIGAFVIIEDRAVIGIGAVIGDGARIEADAVVPAGAVVPPGATVSP